MHQKSKPEDGSASDAVRPLDRDKELELMVQIVAGLLASGHFTYNDDGQAGVLVQPEEEYQWDIRVIKEASFLLDQIRKELPSV